MSIPHSDSLIFFTKQPFSVLRFRPGYRVTFHNHVSLGSSWLWPFLGLSSFLVTLALLRDTGQGWFRIHRTWSHVFLMMRLQLWVAGRKTAEVQDLFHPIVSSVCAIDMTCGC